MKKRSYKYDALLVLFLTMVQVLPAQYFGRNKPQYRPFSFELYHTSHFDIYHYFKSDSLLLDFSQQCEMWYRYHQQTLLDTFDTPNPILVYENHADFQQTNAISGQIDVGTGGVTEGLKRRIVLPISFSAQQSSHVLGHEMVHAFQYHIIEENTRAGLSAIQHIPLFMIEGMAEYMSLGNTYSQTALWMRDALEHKDFPDLKTLSVNYSYSPYRFGHAFWSYISYEYGEQYMLQLLKETANKGMENAIADVLNISIDSLSVSWKNALQQQLLPDSNYIPTVIGNNLITHKNSGNYNLAPAVSPDGQQMIFLSERDLFSLDLFIADTQNGQIKKKLFTHTQSDKVDAINFMETSGTWSNDGKRFAYVAYVKGESTLIIFDVKKQKITQTVIIPEVDAIAYPAWSPTDNSIAFTGLKNGVSDLYLYTINKNKSEQLTTDTYCNLQPSWSNDGNTIYYVTDSSINEHEQHIKPQYNLASLHIKSADVHLYRTFDGAQNLNPVVSAESDKIYFLSDRDGARNLYTLNTNTEEIHQLTFYHTGISGMAPLSPAMTINHDYLYYNLLQNGRFAIVKANIKQMETTQKIINSHQTNFYASRLMPYATYPSLVDINIHKQEQLLAHQSVEPPVSKKEYKTRFKLDYIGNTAIGVASGRFGTGMAGSISARFSDILGNHAIYSDVSINGELYDFGGQVSYVNQKKPVKLGLSLSHIPYRMGYYDNSISDETVYIYRRTFIDKFSLFGYYPINTTHRIETGVSAAYYSYRTEQITNPNFFYSLSAQDKELVDSPSPFEVFIMDVAYVIDNSKYGLASPIEGKRIRVAYEHYFSGVNMNTFLVDFRKYFFIRPYSLAFRLYHYGRFGKGSENDRLVSLYMGYPWYIRGYETGRFYGEDSKSTGKISPNQLLGSKMALANVEWRIPFSGPKDYAWLHSNMFFTELAIFFDAGLTWTNTESPSWSFTTSSSSQRIPLMSSGVSWRINLLGAIIVEPYYAFPIHQGQIKRGNLGFNILSGW